MMRLGAAFVILALVSGACVAEQSEVPAPVETAPGSTVLQGSPSDRIHAVILDYSPTVSDVGALAFLAGHPQVFLLAVTLVGTGETACEPGVAMTRGMLRFLGWEDVPVACGSDDAIDGQNSFPADRRLTPSDIGVPLGDGAGDRNASELISELVRSSALPVEIVAVGPLTNLAVAFAIDPELAALVGGITIMGGALDVPGNVSDGSVAEWNFWVDPVAASDVLRSGAPVTLIPLDATNLLPTGRVFFEALDLNSSTPAARLVRNVWVSQGSWIDNTDNSFYFWDELAAATLVDESVVTFETRNLAVELVDPERLGSIMEGPGGSAIRVATTARRLAFERLLLATLVGAPVELGY